MKHIAASHHVMSNSIQVSMKARPVPYTLRDRVEAGLDRLETGGTINHKCSLWRMGDTHCTSSEG